MSSTQLLTSREDLEQSMICVKFAALVPAANVLKVAYILRSSLRRLSFLALYRLQNHVLFWCPENIQYSYLAWFLATAAFPSRVVADSSFISSSVVDLISADGEASEPTRYAAYCRRVQLG